MKLVIAPDKFKGSLTAEQVCEAIERGARRADPTIDIDAIPMADGGEGTVRALVRAMNGTLVTRRVTGPLPEMKVDATFGWIERDATAVIEMASASGFELLHDAQRDPLATTTFGTGELLRIAASELRARTIILGIGGSATIDAGVGAAQACGFPVILEDGEPVSATEPLCGRDVERIVLIKHGRGDVMRGVQILVACDVNNPLYGPNGAARIFGPQKGATPAVVEQLDAALKQLARRTGRDDLAQHPGAGAAGGLGFGMMAFFGATLRPGAELIIEAMPLRERLRGADLCITGEGRIDEQTLAGKTVQRVASCCKEAGVPCVAIVGEVDQSVVARCGLESALAVQSMTDATRRVEELAMQLVRDRS